MFVLINFEIFDFTDCTLKIPVRLRWINKLSSNMDVGNSWKYYQLHLNSNLEHNIHLISEYLDERLIQSWFLV